MANLTSNAVADINGILFQPEGAALPAKEYGKILSVSLVINGALTWTGIMALMTSFINLKRN